MAFCLVWGVSVAVRACRWLHLSRAWMVAFLALLKALDRSLKGLVGAQRWAQG